MAISNGLPELPKLFPTSAFLKALRTILGQCARSVSAGEGIDVDQVSRGHYVVALKKDASGNSAGGGGSGGTASVAAGDGITVTTSSGTSTIAVKFSATPSDGDMFKWDATGNEFVGVTLATQLEAITGYDAGFSQYLHNNSGSLEWVTATNCPTS